VTAYTDGTHLIADSRDELHAFAAAVGIKRCWFHQDHYDLTTDVARAAVCDARRVTSRTIVNILITTGQRRRKNRVRR
jgi:hypothetical protein